MAGNNEPRISGRRNTFNSLVPTELYICKAREIACIKVLAIKIEIIIIHLVKDNLGANNINCLNGKS